MLLWLTSKLILFLFKTFSKRHCRAACPRETGARRPFKIHEKGAGRMSPQRDPAAGREGLQGLRRAGALRAGAGRGAGVLLFVAGVVAAGCCAEALPAVAG